MEPVYTCVFQVPRYDEMRPNNKEKKMGEQKNTPYKERNVVNRIATMRGEVFSHLKQNPRERRDALLAKHGITYSYRFIPHSGSSHAQADTLTLNG